MFTNLDFLNLGKPWIPENSTYRERQQNYVNGRLLYEGKLEKVFSEVWQKIKSRYNDEQVMVAVNLFRCLCETFKVLAFKDEPQMWVGTGETAKKLEEYFNAGHIRNVLRSSFISGYAQGEGVYKVYLNSKGQYDISVISPENWIPVHNPQNLDEILCHVVANEYEENNDTTWFGITKNTVQKYLYVEIHYIGRYEKRTYELDNNNIISRLISSEEIKTGYNDFCVFPFNYTSTAWRKWGVSQFNDLIPIVEEIIARLSNNSKILDEHADPQLVGTKDMLEFDNATGEYVYNRHKMLTIDSRTGATPSYLTWDGNLASSENMINKMFDLFYMVSGTNPQLYGQDIAGNLSGEAMAKIFVVPIAKTKEMILALEETAQKAFECALSLQGVKLPVDIQFNIGDFNSLEDIVNRVSQEKSAGIISLRNAVEQVNPRYTAEEVENELAQIQEDNQSNFAVNLEDIYPKDEQ